MNEHMIAGFVSIGLLAFLWALDVAIAKEFNHESPRSVLGYFTSLPGLLSIFIAIMAYFIITWGHITWID